METLNNAESTLEARINGAETISGLKMFAYVDGKFVFYPGSSLNKGYVLDRAQAEEILNKVEKREFSIGKFIVVLALLGAVAGIFGFIFTIFANVQLLSVIAGLIILIALVWDFVWKGRRFRKKYPDAQPALHRFPYGAYWQKLMPKWIYSLGMSLTFLVLAAAFSFLFLSVLLLSIEYDYEILRVQVIVGAVGLLFLGCSAIYLIFVWKHVVFRRKHGRKPQAEDVLPIDPVSGEMVMVRAGVFS